MAALNEGDVSLDGRVEADTQSIGERVFERVRAAERTVTDTAWWEEKILEWCMSHPELKVELFRFIDVLPALHPNAVTAHLLEYLGDARDDMPPLLRWSVDLAPSKGALARLVARSARRNVQRMAKRFIAGSTTGEAVAAIRRLRRERLSVTLDVLGEAVITETEADAYQAQYLELLRETSKVANRFAEDPLIDRDYDGAPLPRVNVSLKLSALAAVFDPLDPEGTARVVVPRLRRILDTAREVGAFVYVDMEHYEIKDLILRLFKETLEDRRYVDFGDVGVVLQAYLKDCEADMIDLANWAGGRGARVWVRLVKGAYWDYETVVAAQRDWSVPVWAEKWQSDRNFERCTDLLLERSDVLRPALGSHNVRSLSHGIAAARARGLPEHFLEIQTLYGMADSVKRAMVDVDQRVRVYTPYGELIPGMAYLVRRLLENTSNESFVRHRVVDGQSVRQLMRAPMPLGRPHEHEEVPMIQPVSEASSQFRNEALQDFSKEKVQKKVAAAISSVEGRFGLECPVIIDGKDVETSAKIESRCPSDARRIVAVSGCASAAEADRAVSAASRAWSEWRSLGVERRAAIIDEAAALLAERRDELVAWTCWEAGKPWRDADADVAEAIDFCRYYALRARELFRPERVGLPGEENVTMLQPRGVVAVISPWNFPLAIPCGMTVAALVTGNTVVLKPAEQTPACAYQLYRVLRDAGVPAGVLSFLPGFGESAGARLVEHPDVAAIAFTGSRAVGHWIARRAAETSTGRFGIKRVVAEMGGKNAIVVDDDADLDEAVPGVLASAFGYAGQKCSACSRVIVVDAIYDAFLERARGAAASVVIGEARHSATTLGPLIDRESVDRVFRYVAVGRESGTLVYEGKVPEQLAHGYFAAPAIIADLQPSSPILTEEIFGPVLAVLRARTFEEAIDLANGTDYALTGGVYSRSPSHIDRARERLDVGNLYVNRKITGALVGRQPFGGYRHSGTGNKAGGRHYLLEFVTSRTICENTMRSGFAPEE